MSSFFTIISDIYYEGDENHHHSITVQENEDGVASLIVGCNLKDDAGNQKSVHLSGDECMLLGEHLVNLGRVMREEGSSFRSQIEDFISECGMEMEGHLGADDDDNVVSKSSSRSDKSRH